MLFAQRNYVGHQLQSDKLTVETNDGTIDFIPYTSYSMEVKFTPKSGDHDNEASLDAVILPPQKIQAAFDEGDKALEYGIDKGISVRIKKAPFGITFFYESQKILEESAGYFNADTLKGFRFQIEDGEHIYGAGERAMTLDRKGHRFPLYNRAHYGYEDYSEQMNFGLPLVLSSNNYALLMDNPQVGFLDIAKTRKNELSFELIGGRMSYFVIAGPSMKEVTQNYVNMTGYQPMPPRWALGNFASRFGYRSQEEVMNVVKKFREQNIPLDAIVLDLYWFGPEVQGFMGNLDWDSAAFPSPQQMIDELDNMGVKTVLITEPFILTSSSTWDDAVAKKVLGTDKDGHPFVFNFFFGETGLVDIWKPEAKDWFWQFYKKQIDLGVAGWWGDLGEPEVHPKELQHVNGSADEVHNAYGHEWAKTLFNKYSEEYEEERPFFLMRSGFAGSQRFGMFPWSGDVNRTFGGLRAQPNIALTMGMSGLGYMSSDLGGFANGGQTQKDVEELYARWLQYGVFQPIFRPHAQEDIPSEAIFFEGETREYAEAAIQLRYKLLPYIYTLAYENHTKGTPLMRPLMYLEEENKKLLNYSDAYLFGNNFLVAPVLKKGQKSMKVYLPKGNTWFDFYTGKAYKGGQSIQVDLTMDHIPVFVRGFVPMLPLIQHTEAYKLDEMEVHYYNDPMVKNQTSEVYDDDGRTKGAYEKGQYMLIKMQAVQKGKKRLSMLLSKEGGEYVGKPQAQKITLMIHNWTKAPKSVKVNNNSLSREEYEYHEDKNMITIKTTWEEGDLEVSIK
ncbi:glycoside hydrolase family 31 protein [Algivirga pacifica]|uniref:Glycoside hydrolase family 31 protein n=2 Tax=Algivirga pacifica TaxID=1162670 RepID=A0ABP9DCX2_9BACT